jgi:hypothetical protein
VLKQIGFGLIRLMIVSLTRSVGGGIRGQGTMKHSRIHWRATIESDTYVKTIKYKEKQVGVLCQWSWRGESVVWILRVSVRILAEDRRRRWKETSRHLERWWWGPGASLWRMWLGSPADVACGVKLADLMPGEPKFASIYVRAAVCRRMPARQLWTMPGEALLMMPGERSSVDDAS